VKDTEVDHSQTPEVASLRSLVSLAAEANQLLPELANGSVFDLLAASPEGRRILEQFDQLVDLWLLARWELILQFRLEDPNRWELLFNSLRLRGRGKRSAETHREEEGRVAGSGRS